MPSDLRFERHGLSSRTVGLDWVVGVQVISVAGW